MPVVVSYPGTFGLLSKQDYPEKHTVSCFSSNPPRSKRFRLQMAGRGQTQKELTSQIDYYLVNLPSRTYGFEDKLTKQFD